MYSVREFGAMIDSGVRIEAYRRALSSCVVPGSVVLDLGSGTGAMALIACRLGARRVYAIEPSNAIQIGRESAAANGFENRIVFIQDLSTRVSLPEQVDLLLEDMRGALPWFGSHIPDLIDARQRMLRPGGQIISCRDTAYCAVVEAEKFYVELTRPWRTSAEGLDLSAATRYVLNSNHKYCASPDQMLTHAHAWARLDYATIDSPHARGNFSLDFSRAGTAHGLLLWFDGELAPGITICNAPGEPRTPYGPLLLPWPEPVAVQKGDRVDVTLRGDLVGDDYVWSWNSQVRLRGAEGGRVLQFRQSTFLGTPITRESLSRRASGSRPRLNRDGRAARFVLDRMQGAMQLSEIAEQLALEHPDRFRSRREALDYVAGVAGLYGEQENPNFM